MRAVRRIVAVAVVAGLVLGGACGDDDDEGGGGATRRSSTSSTTTTAPTPEAAVEAAYLAYWEMAQRLVEAPDPDDPEIAERATGQVAHQLTDSLTTLRSRDQAVRSGPRYVHDVLSVSVSADSAQVIDCAIDDAVVVNVLTGETVEERLITVLLETTLRLAGGTWLVSDVHQQESWEGVSACNG